MRLWQRKTTPSSSELEDDLAIRMMYRLTFGRYGEAWLTKLGKAWLAEAPRELFESAKLPAQEVERLVRRYTSSVDAGQIGISSQTKMAGAGCIGIARIAQRHRAAF